MCWLQFRTASQLLKTHISGLGLPLGTTPTGADWCIKALHPADPLTEVRGIPDLSAVPSVCMNYQMTMSFGPDPAATGTWSFAASLLPHPVEFMYVDVVDSVSPTGRNVDVLNPQLDGTTHYDKYATFKELAQRWRLAYMSVTLYQDGPDLANQGTIVAAQCPVAPKRFPVNYTASPQVFTFGQCNMYTVEDLPNFNVCQSMPNAYFNRSREGCYVPLKLTETCQDWQDESSQIYISDLTNPAPAPSLPELYVVRTGTVPAFPHTSLQPLSINLGTSVAGQPTSAMLNGTFAHICGQNLSVQTSISMFIRCGIEMQCSPLSTISPQLKLSPPYDPVALETYFRIARELKDGYPANYNDLGKIWDVISKAAKNVLPFVGAMGPYGAGAAGIGSAVVGLGDTIRERRKAKAGVKGRDSLPAAEVDRAHEQQKFAAQLAQYMAQANQKKITSGTPRMTPRRKVSAPKSSGSK